MTAIASNQHQPKDTRLNTREKTADCTYLSRSQRERRIKGTTHCITHDPHIRKYSIASNRGKEAHTQNERKRREEGEWKERRKREGHSSVQSIPY